MENQEDNSKTISLQFFPCFVRHIPLQVKGNVKIRTNTLGYLMLGLCVYA